MENKKVTKETSRTEATAASPDAKRSPVRSFREGEVSASVFAREHQFKGEAHTFYSVSFTRSYKDSTGQWQYTKNFDADDLGRLVAVAQKAAEYVHGLKHPEQAAQK